MSLIMSLTKTKRSSISTKIMWLTSIISVLVPIGLIVYHSYWGIRAIYEPRYQGNFYIPWPLSLVWVPILYWKILALCAITLVVSMFCNKYKKNLVFYVYLGVIIIYAVTSLCVPKVKTNSPEYYKKRIVTKIKDRAAIEIQSEKRGDTRSTYKKITLDGNETYAFDANCEWGFLSLCLLDIENEMTDAVRTGGDVESDYKIFDESMLYIKDNYKLCMGVYDGKKKDYEYHLVEITDWTINKETSDIIITFSDDSREYITLETFKLYANNPRHEG